MAATLITAILALCASVAWGSGDFTGGLVARRIGAVYALLTSYIVGLAALVMMALVRSEPLSPPIDLMWGALSGLFGMIGFGFLLRGFAIGRMGIVAPVSAVLAAALPVIFTALSKGLPPELQLIGFVFGLISIWLLSRPERLSGHPAGVGMALLAGIGFGIFFISLDQVSEGSVFWPLAAGRLASIIALVAFVLIRRQPLIPSQRPYLLITLAGILDVVGNFFFLMAIKSGRLDVASVLGSLYPAVTAILAVLVAKEQMHRLQVIGVVMAVLAIALITV